MQYVQTVKGNWQELKLKLKARYTNLTDLDLESGETKRGEMMDALQSRLGKTRQELIKILNTL
jgi:hypothetical protein